MAGQTSEVEETLKRLQAHKGVIGVVIVNQDGIPIRTTFDQAVTVQYAGLITQLCSKARSAVRELDPQVPPALAHACRRVGAGSRAINMLCGDEPRSLQLGHGPLQRADFGGRGFGYWVELTLHVDVQNDLTFLRLRSKKHEIMVAPDKDYLLIIIQDPNNLGA